MLCMARVCHRVSATHATGVPLGAEVDDRRFKLISVDVGLVSAALGLRMIGLNGGTLLANTGAIAEQVVGQGLRLIEPSFRERFNADVPSVTRVSMRTTTGAPVKYELLWRRSTWSPSSDGS